MGFLKILSKGNIFLMASGCRLRQLLVYWPWTPIWALFLMTHFIVVGAKTPATKLAIVWFFTWKIKEIIRWVLITIKIFGSDFLDRIFGSNFWIGFLDRIFFSAIDQIILILLNAESLLSYSARWQYKAADNLCQLSPEVFFS